MKSKLKIFAIVFFLVSSLAFKVADNILTQMGINEQQAQQEVLNYFLENEWYQNDPENASFPISLSEKESYTGNRPKSKLTNWGSVPYWLSNAKTYIANGNKIEATQKICEYFKNYVESDAFMNAYQKIRASKKPAKEAEITTSGLDYYNQVSLPTLKNNEKALADIKKKGSKLDANDKLLLTMYEGLVEQGRLEEELNKNKTPRASLYAFMYPENPSEFIKRKLENYLAFVASVDFKATTKQQGRYLKFTNSEYEGKSRQWKAVYRAGADANKVITDFIKQWLKDGIKVSTSSIGANNASNNNNSTNVEILAEKNESNTSKPAKEPNKEKTKDKIKGLLKKKLF